MAHARRYFVNAGQNDKARSDRARMIFQEIYDPERQMKSLSLEERYRLRQEVILLKLDALHAWMMDQYKSHVNSSSFKEALNYSLKRMEVARAVHLEIMWPTAPENISSVNEVADLVVGRQAYVKTRAG